MQPTEKSPLLNHGQEDIPEKRDPLVVSPERFLCHHRLLMSFNRLRWQICTQQGLFRVEHSKDLFVGMNKEQQRSKMPEKRWSIYLARAIHRFRIWWQMYVPSSSNAGGAPAEKRGVERTETMEWREDTMPPLGIQNSHRFLQRCNYANYDHV